MLDQDAKNQEDLKTYQKKPYSILKGVKKIPANRLVVLFIDFLHSSQKILESECLCKEDHEYLQKVR